MVASVPLGNAVVEIMAYEEDVERLFSWLKTPEELHDEFRVVQDRSVGLFGRACAGRKRTGAAKFREGAVVMTLEDTAASVELAVCFDKIQDGLANVFAHNGIMKDSGTGGSGDSG